ncbi:MAG: DsbE family thiol:disulfide interchange protein [Zoogloeaceae bacterium]|jgi:cytochrome c biogenesis protein CcmG/thiol:disulfide interchange protein DsbE|nr:DsbE family thiol:disulfide interchange protein [Zoogloeaceae bacterium]
MNNRYLWLFVAFALLIVLLAVGLTRDPREIPSPLIDKPAPEFVLPRLDNDQPFTPKDMAGRVWLLNVWASWCASCRDEHPLLVDLAQKKLLPIVGLNYKEVRGDLSLDATKLALEAEKREAAARANLWLATHGNPYTLSILDLDGKVGIDYGVYGVPETYLIDETGIIRFKQIGPITPETLEKKLLPLIAQRDQKTED